jgi:hypothetical protein
MKRKVKMSASKSTVKRSVVLKEVIDAHPGPGAPGTRLTGRSADDVDQPDLALPSPRTLSPAGERGECYALRRAESDVRNTVWAA